MSTASVAAGPAVAKNPLGRVALAVAILQVLVGVVWTTVQPTLISQLTMTPPTSGTDPMPSGLATIGLMTTVANATMLVLALIALVLGIVACRRAGLSKVGGAIAIGVGGSAVATYVALLIGGLAMTLIVTA